MFRKIWNYLMILLAEYTKYVLNYSKIWKIKKTDILKIKRFMNTQ